METLLLIPLIKFAFVSSATPGPNNMMLLASGANFGFRRTIPHMLGISLGHMFMVTMVGLVLSQVFETYPIILTVLKWVCVAYLLYLAWKIANSAPIGEGTNTAKPFSFLQAAAFQWVNPKAWFMALTATSAYTVEHSVSAVLLVAVVFACTNLPSITLWVLLGQQIRRFLQSPARLRAFNIIMALLLVSTLWPILMGH